MAPGWFDPGWYKCPFYLNGKKRDIFYYYVLITGYFFSLLYIGFVRSTFVTSTHRRLLVIIKYFI